MPSMISSTLNTRSRSSRFTALASAFMISTAMIATPMTPLLAPAIARGAPESFAPLVEQVIDAVVNISASQTVENRSVPLPQVPPGAPFEDFFNEFFNRRGEGGEGQPNQRQPNQPNQRRGEGGPNNGQNPGQGPGQQRRSNSLGSGFVIDASGIVITNNHVIGEANDITVNFNDGTKLKAEVVGRDAKTDIAVLRVKSDKPLKFVKFGDDRAARVGDWVVAIGNPFGFDSSVSAGILSARNRRINSGPYDNFIQTDAAINRGNSGGPLFNSAGEVIGINTAIISPSGGSIGIGFAVPASTAVPVIDQLKNFGETRRGWLGVRIQEVDDGIAETLGLGKVRGALVAGIDDKGPAKPAGIEAGDVIIKFDGKDVKDSRELPRIVATTAVGKAVDVTVVRKGKEVVKQVTLARLEDGERQASAAKPAEAPAAPTQVRRALGLDLVPLNAEARKRLNIKDTVKGVLIGKVDANSNAATKRLAAGDVIVEVGQEPVATAAEVLDRVEKLKKEGRKSALLLVANAQGELRFVAVTIE
ncbi:MAG: Do family serine endopeptidase [Beijerinckiaceae bacterium]